VVGNTKSQLADDQREWTSLEAVAAFHAGRITAERYVSTLLDHAQRMTTLNAFITINADGALAAAHTLDAARARGDELPPLAGVVLAVKDNINLQGVPTSSGTAALKNACPRTTAPSLRKLLDAGAIVLGKANMHELAFGITSTNLSFAGPVRNPYDPNCIPGGSSGGTAAAIAARIVPCGLGTDTGASTRLPAALTGIAGMRPSVGNGGAERRYHDEDAVMPASHTRDTVGAMGRTVADVVLLDAVITGCPRVSAVPLHGLRLGVPKCLWDGLDPRLAEVVWAGRERLAAAGVNLVEDDMPGLLELNEAVSFPIVLHEPLLDVPRYLAASGIEDLTVEEIFANVASPDVKGLVDMVMSDAFGPAYEDAIHIHRPALQRLYAKHFARHRLDGLLFPTSILPACAIDAELGSGTVSIAGGEPMDTLAAYVRNTDPGANAGIPGLSVPVGLTYDGLPVGLEIDGPLGTDEHLLRIGLAMEGLFGRLPGTRL
jgi:mandelamide amidase